MTNPADMTDDQIFEEYKDNLLKIGVEMIKLKQAMADEDEAATQAALDALESLVTRNTALLAELAARL
jgi:hypothetical protein